MSDNGTKITVVTAPEPWVNAAPGAVAVYLAGQGQGALVERIATIPNLGEVVAYNPRRGFFPGRDPVAEHEQIEWEFLMLDRAHVYSVWIGAVGADQDLTMYELGRHLALRVRDGQTPFVAVGVEPGYRWERDVEVQVDLACGAVPGAWVGITRDLAAHARAVGLAVLAARVFGEQLRAKANGGRQ